jgi:uncharacterized Zn finger protein (UPF0148 family)
MGRASRCPVFASFLANGFARARCAECGHDSLIAWSCKGRGVCPACNTRRMVETAAHLADHVDPRLPVRQWALAVPKRLRYQLEQDRAIETRVCASKTPTASVWSACCATAPGRPSRWNDCVKSTQNTGSVRASSPAASPGAHAVRRVRASGGADSVAAPASAPLLRGAVPNAPLRA